MCPRDNARGITFARDVERDHHPLQSCQSCPVMSFVRTSTTWTSRGFAVLKPQVGVGSREHFINHLATPCEMPFEIARTFELPFTLAIEDQLLEPPQSYTVVHNLLILGYSVFQLVSICLIYSRSIETQASNLSSRLEL